jgi:hypothetical protein
MANPWIPHWDDGVVRFDAGWRWPTAEEIAAAKLNAKSKRKMKRQSYYPSRFADQIPWLENFRTKLPGYATVLELVTADVDAAVASCRYTVYVLSQWLPAVRAFGPASTEAIDQLLDGPQTVGAIALPTFTAPALPTGVVPVPAGVLALIFQIVETIKNADAYTDTIGQDLGIIGAQDTTEHPTPQVKATIMEGATCECAKLTFKKFGHMGVYLESRRNNGAWEFLTIDTESPYNDERPLLVAGQPEIREYRARFWDKGTPNGDWCDVIRVTVGS